MLPFTDELYGGADFIFQQDLAPAHTAKTWFNGRGITVLDWPANHRESMGHCQEKDERHETEQ